MMVLPMMKSVTENITPKIPQRKPRSSTNPQREIPARACSKYRTAPITRTYKHILNQSSPVVLKCNKTDIFMSSTSAQILPWPCNYIAVFYSRLERVASFRMAELNIHSIWTIEMSAKFRPFNKCQKNHQKSRVYQRALTPYWLIHDLRLPLHKSSS